MHTTTLQFARRNEDTLSLAILTLKTETPLSGAEALFRFKAGITDWIKATDAGQRHWQDAYGTFGIEDLAKLGLGDLVSLESYLAPYGINFQDVTFSDSDKALDYDTVLVETSLDAG